MPRNKYRFLEDIATADAAFEAYGADLAELLTNAAEAMFAVIAELDVDESTCSRSFEINAADEETLLFDLLSELVYLKDKHRELYFRFEISVSGAEQLTAQVLAQGVPLERVRDFAKTDIKAVTYHRLNIDTTPDGKKAVVVLDL